MVIKTISNKIDPIAINIPPLINRLFSLSTSCNAILTCRSITELAIAESLEAVFVKFLFFDLSIYFLPAPIKEPINRPIPAAMAIDKIGFFLMGPSIFGLKV